jgi:hypothetical protein
MDTAVHKGKKFWSGIFDAHDGFIRETHPYKRAQAADFHHSLYVSPQSQDAMRHGDAGFFWVDPDGSVNTHWRDDEAPKHIVDSIKNQIEPIAKADGGSVDRTENLAAWHEGSHPTTKNPDGTPKVFYHGTRNDFSTFNKKHRYKSGRAIFVSQTPEMAHFFATVEHDKPGNPNIMPLFVHTKNPFDYENPDHVKMVLDNLAQEKDLIEMEGPQVLQYYKNKIQKGEWGAIEDPWVQDAIKKNHDGFFAHGFFDVGNGSQKGEKFLSVFDPSQIKSATGNQGTFDPSNPDITKRDGGDVEGLDPSIDMSIDKQNNRLSAKAIDDWNKAIGHATFNIGDNSELDPQHVEVHEDYRKSGIAKKLYDHVARRGYKIIRSNDQTDAGHAFWNKHQGSNKVWRVNKEGGGALSDEDGITAYHGSPHDFDQFDINKIGTGEGNQAFGHGLYFAQNEKVAKNYKDMLAPEVPSEGGTMADAYSLSREQHAMMDENDLDAHFADIDDNSVEKIWRNGKTTHFFNDGSALIDEGDHLRPVKKGKGHMYEVHIKAHPDHFLDWDEVLEDQSDHIKNALRRVAKHDEAQMGYSDLHDQLDEPEGYTGGAFYQTFADRGRAKEASEILKKMGIKGIRYKDAGSRIGNEETTHNYVVFDHNHVAVKRKYARGGMVEEARQKKANGGVSYSGDFSSPDYYGVYNAMSSGLGPMGKFMQFLLPNPATTGAYDAYMNANKPTSFTPITTPSFQKTDSISVPAQKPIGGFSGFGYSPMPSFDYFSKPSFNDWQPNNQASDWGDEPLPEVPAALQRFNAPAPQQASPQQAAPQQAAPQQAAAAPAKAPQGKKHGGSIVERALMITSRKA